MSQPVEISRSKILREFQHFLSSRGFKSGADFDPWERETKRTWDAVPGTAFTAHFIETHSEFRDYTIEVHQVATEDIGPCFKISP